jgi:hypothetical protein
MREALEFVAVGVYAVALGVATVLMLGWLLGKEPKLAGWSVSFVPAPTTISLR